MFTGVRCECELSVSYFNSFRLKIHMTFSLGASERKQATLLATGRGIRLPLASLFGYLASLVGIRRLRLINNNVL